MQRIFMEVLISVTGGLGRRRSRGAARSVRARLQPCRESAKIRPTLATGGSLRESAQIRPQFRPLAPDFDIVGQRTDQGEYARRAPDVPSQLGAPGLDFETWETANLNRPSDQYHGHSLPILFPFFLPYGWETSTLDENRGSRREQAISPTSQDWRGAQSIAPVGSR